MQQLKLTTINRLPKPEVEPCSDWQFKTVMQSDEGDASDVNQSYLVYAEQRDFLSTPRTYVVIKLNKSEFVDVSMNEYDLTEFHKKFQLFQMDQNNGRQQILSDDLLEAGLYEAELISCETSPQQKMTPTDGNLQLIIVMSDNVVQVTCANYELATRLYYCLDAADAFKEYRAI